ncbi:MAG TPA: hypothetical protein VM597_09605 [Gemmataceae bacterium]|jgi:hypothetical protein|nr:hypothetical protein [Gemmataceae bacterium]
MSADATPTRSGKKLALVILMAVLLLVPVVYGLALLGAALLQGQPFESPAELTPENVQSLRAHLLNRRELDSGEDVGPYYAAAEDYERLLAPLKAAAEVGPYPDARGPFLGEYRVVLKNGRKGTIRLYWSRLPGGGTADKPPVARLRFQIGEHLYEGAAAADVIRAVEESAARGKTGR